MTPKEQKAVMALLVHAAVADGEKSDAERAALKRMSQALPSEDLNSWVVYQEVLSGKLPLDQVARDLETRETRLLAYEMALGVCETDGVPNASEQEFLSRLRSSLGMAGETGAVQDAEQSAQQVATALPAALSSNPPPLQSKAQGIPENLVPVDSVVVEKRVLNQAILTGALELLPQSLATMAVVPLQVKLVYGIGRDHGYTLDRGHIREFMGAAGAGLAAQAVEGYARKLLGGLVGGMLGRGLMGGMGRGLASTGAGAAITFAATYALGHLAIRYYSGVRKMEMAVRKDTYAKLLDEGQRQFGPNRLAVEQRASTLSPTEIINLVRQK